MTSIEQSICDAIDIIVSKAVSEAEYDRTIQCTIVSCSDATIGKYKVRYQDSTFYAYATSTDVTYTSGNTVYVLIPGNDMSNDKTILGTVEKLGINYVSTAEGDEAYEVVGTNCISSSSTFGLCSYNYGIDGTYVKTLYSKDYDNEDNLISFDETSLSEYILQSDYLICGGVIKTALPTEQQFKGNYGIIFGLDFLDNASGETVTKYYTVDVDTMTGNPYKLINATRQYGIFEIDGENFQCVNSVSIFTSNFPNTTDNEDEWEEDIWISDFEFSGATLLDDEELSGYTLTFLTTEGTYFDGTDNDSSTRSIVAQVRVKGKVVDADAQGLPFYWFVEHSGITSDNVYYNKYGGQGWKCLNDYNVIQTNDDADPTVVEWVAADDTWTVSKSDIVAATVTYKCAVVYDDTILTGTITIKNLSSAYELTIESDSGTQFYYDIGYPTLTCLVNGESSSSYTYSWAVLDNNNSFSSLAETTNLNEDYNSLVQEYNELVAAIEKGTKYYEANKSTLLSLETSIAAYDTITRVEGNVIYKLNVNTITSFSTYQCTVYYGSTYIGTVSIVLLNTLSSEGLYSLIINNGTYTYKYNENGISPTSSAVDSPIDIQALSFTLYNNLGEEIDIDNIDSSNIQWIVPSEDTLLSIPNDYDITSENDDGTYTYVGFTQLAYEIASRYDITKTNNDITLLVNYKDLNLSAKTNLTFVKEGESGTNGTEYSCKIALNTQSGVTAPVYPIVTFNPNGSESWNFTPVNSNKYFKIELYHNETLIYSGVTSGNAVDEETSDVAVTIVWSMLANQYTAKVSDTSVFSINSSTGAVSVSNIFTSNLTHVASIVKATVTYQDVVYYATLPIILIKQLSSTYYKAVLKDNTGFQYAIYTSDGQSPKYDNSNPFELIVTRYINGYWEDISTFTTSSYNPQYDWSVCGSVYGSSWEDAIYLKENITGISDLTKNQYSIKPLDSYDGQSVTNAVECIVSNNGVDYLLVHIPIHLMLNRYGLAALNSWDGNSVTIDEDGGYILAPQIGAGQKESDNSFTGIVMGVVKESGSSDSEIGLFGYNYGQRSIFLDAEDGSATFGVTGKSQIIIDPGGDTGQIKSGNYDGNDSYSSKATGTAGLLIDLTSPFIQYGSGNFSVSEEGYLTARGGGTIAAWSISDDTLSAGSGSNTVGMSAAYSSASSVAFWAGKSASNKASAPFNVTYGGALTSTSGSIGGWDITDDALSSNNLYLSADGYIYSNNHSTFSAGTTGFYLGPDGLSLGSHFWVDKSGEMFAEDGTIGGWNITSNSLYADDLYLSASGYIYSSSHSSLSSTGSGFYLGSSGLSIGSAFKVTSAGSLTATSGTIGGWSITSSTLGISGLTLSSSGSIYSSGWSINSDGSASFSNVTISGGSLNINGLFQVDSNGNLTATSGTIGGWSITSSTLSSTKVTLNSSGAITGDGWSITADGLATFSNINVTGGTMNISSSSSGFSVSSSGTLTATNANISGKITATSGTIGGCSIVDGTLTISNANITSLDAAKLTLDGTTVVWKTIQCIGSLSSSVGYYTNVNAIVTDCSLEGDILTGYELDKSRLTLSHGLVGAIRLKYTVNSFTVVGAEEDSSEGWALNMDWSWSS